jgi:alpha-D-ribose 1-methylphosphonate 5-triphosphate diphosphatase
LPLVSYEDHTPGQGQYTDRRAMERYIAGTKGLSADEAERYIDRLIAERDAHLAPARRRDALARRQGACRRAPLMCHDPATPTTSRRR